MNSASFTNWNYWNRMLRFRPDSLELKLSQTTSYRTIMQKNTFYLDLKVKNHPQGVVQQLGWSSDTWILLQIQGKKSNFKGHQMCSFIWRLRGQAVFPVVSVLRQWAAPRSPEYRRSGPSKGVRRSTRQELDINCTSDSLFLKWKSDSGSFCRQNLGQTWPTLF